MKTLYLIKSLLPVILLPVAPGMLQLELAKQGLLQGGWATVAIAIQGIFTLATLAWLTHSILRKQERAFLRMSCVSKKVFFQGRWMAVEEYLAMYHNVVVSHGMTPDEMQAWVADAEEYLRREQLEAEMSEFEETVA